MLKDHAGHIKPVYLYVSQDKKSSLQPEKPSEQAKQKNTFFTARS